MVTQANSINEAGASGLVNFNGTATFGTTACTQYNVLTGASANTVNNVAPSATSGVPFISQGSSAQPVFGTAVVAGGGTGATTLTQNGVLYGNGTSAVGITAAGTTGQVLTATTSAAPSWAAPAAGFAIQQVRTSTSALNHITSTHVVDDNIPQNTYGSQVMTVSITPTSLTSVLVIQCSIFAGLNGAQNAGFALFQDSTANALTANAVTGSGDLRVVSLLYSMTSGTTSSTTFKVRAWPSANTLDINGIGNTRAMGGVANTWMTVTEYAS